MQTFAQLKAKIKGRLWPAGEQTTLITPHDAAFQAALLDLQKWVPCLKQFNVSTWASADRQWENAKTVVNAPYGKIRRVYTVAGGLDRWRDRVFYRSGTFHEIGCWARRLYGARTPANAGLPVLPFGFKQEEAASDWQYGRARQGLWAIDRKRLYIAPWLQSTELLVVEWDGEKNAWLDSDGVDETYWRPDAEAAIEYLVGFRHHLWYGDRSLAPDLLKLYEKARADLMYWCREFTCAQENLICNSDGGGEGLAGYTGTSVGGGTGSVTDDDDDPTEDTTDEDNVLFVAVGDMGDPNANTSAVAAAIQSDSPELFLALGDISYNNDYAADFAVNYQWAMTAGILAPIPGNHDWDIDGTLAAYLAYFAQFTGNNGHNYEVTAGPIHFLGYDSDARFADGIDVNSTQAQWLQAKLFLSTARWKIVFLHRPPFSSDTTHGSDTALQLPFKAWGADLVIAGHAHAYERLSIGDLPYINVGTGGRALHAFGAPVSGSQARFVTYGRLIGQADCDQLNLTFKAVDGSVLDSLTLTKT